ncbi:MAG: Xaa-Pro peptidase family protein [Syntrophobacteraceae bacterium]
MLKVPAGEIADRIVTLQSLLLENDVDAAVIRQNADLYYFSGTVQDAHLIVPAAGRPVYMVRRSVERAENQSPLRPIVPLASMKELPPAVFDACGARTPLRLGFELDVLPANAFFFYDEQLFPKQRIVDIGGLIRQVRSVKSPWEVDVMRRAGDISRAVADAVPGILQEGMTEFELAGELERVARKAGSLEIIRTRTFNMEMGFGHILSGPDAAVPSYTDTPTGGPGTSPAFGQGPGTRRIRANEIVNVDTMVSCHGYLNDQTRNFCLGRPPSEILEAYRFVQSAHERFRELAKPGSITGKLYETVLQWADDAGWASFFMGWNDSRVTFVGHGLGLEVDEFPFIARGHTLALREGMTFAFEPKVIIPDVGIAGLENTYVVTEAGLESLNTASEDLLVL